MIGSAVKNQIPLIYLYESKKDFDSFIIRTDSMSLGSDMVDTGFIDTRKHAKNLEFASLNISDRNFKKLENCLIDFYKQKNK